jgi:putative 4-mercaptohistidine N1-methyltranferase
MEGRKKGRVLDIGCAVGRSSFELGHHFEEVVGIDFSTRFIRHAIDLKEKGQVSYYLKEEGEIAVPVTRTLKSLGLSGENVHFWQGDACNLKPNFTGYDLILAVNLIDRLYDPALFLSTVHERLNPGGLLLLGSPYTWQEASTPKDKWVGGYRDGEHPVYTLEGLERLLGGHFSLIEGPEPIEFVIRETKRKFQHSFSEFTVWEKQ